MPNTEGELSEEERLTILDHLKKKAPHGVTCPISGSQNWSVGKFTVTPVVLQPDGTARLIKMDYPQVMLISEAGYIMYMSAKEFGIQT